MKHNDNMKSQPVDSEVHRFLDAWFAARQFIQASNFNRFQGAGLSATQFMTLNLLPSSGEGLSMGELARAMNLKPATIAKTVDSLEARSLVKRTRNLLDRRTIIVQVTPQGLSLQNAANSQFQTQIASLFLTMTSDERHALISGLEAFVQAAATHASPGPGQPSRGRRVAAPAKRSARKVQPL